MQSRLEREVAGHDQIDDVEVAVSDAEDGELGLEAADCQVQPREEEQRDDEDADDVGHQLVAEECSREAAFGEPFHGATPHDDRLATTPGLRALVGQGGQARVVGGKRGVLVGGRGRCLRVGSGGRRRGGHCIVHTVDGRSVRGGVVGRRCVGHGLLSLHAFEADRVIVGVDEYPPESEAEQAERRPHHGVQVAQLVPIGGTVDLPPRRHGAAGDEDQHGHVQRHGSLREPALTHGGNDTGPRSPGDFAARVGRCSLR